MDRMGVYGQSSERFKYKYIVYLNMPICNNCKMSISGEPIKKIIKENVKEEKVMLERFFCSTFCYSSWVNSSEI